ncbi:hypothetical protein N0V88_007809 [Collariella sp. IMI 366227]|nr:hypothetical protein N0V88_007809 [Collariella sp. IMI 366227]
MSRRNRHHLPDYNYDYSPSSTSPWDTRTFIGVDNDDDNDTTSRYSHRPSATVIGLGYNDLHHRHTRHSTAFTNTCDQNLPKTDRRDRNRIRLRNRDTSTHSHRPSLKPSHTTPLTNLILTSPSKESLKQRLDRTSPHPGLDQSMAGLDRFMAEQDHKFRMPKPQYNQVHALILTWSFHDLRTEDYTAPPSPDYVSLEDETRRLRATLEGYGYTVHEFLIPMHMSKESLQKRLQQFLRYAADDTLLMIYYHGHGALDDNNELVFSSHDHPENAEWAKNAAVELYAALMRGDTCSRHGQKDKYQQLLKK